VRMAEAGHDLSPTALKLKVSEITMTTPTPFRNGIPGGGWMPGWRLCHPKLSLCTPGALETARAKKLCEENIKSFYNNLETLYTLYKYPPHRLWNADETGC
jgi:hypothetical protein